MSFQLFAILSNTVAFRARRIETVGRDRQERCLQEPSDGP
jgi:hypothetical protein